MKTVVYQSYRTSNVPGWVQQCMQSVRAWAKSRGYDYCFVDDRLFDYVPDWYKEKAQGNMLLLADLARLELAHEYLSKGAERTIWVDADVIVFDQAGFDVAVTEEFAFCKEVWLRRQEVFGVTLPVIRIDYKVNNAVTVFTKNNSMLNFYRKACLSLVDNMPRRFDPGYASTTFLTWLNKRVKLPLLTNVGLFSPPILSDLCNGGGKYASLYMRKFGNAIQAANLCGTFNNGTYMGVEMSDNVYERAISLLIESNGQVLNRYLTQPSLPTVENFHILSKKSLGA